MNRTLDILFGEADRELCWDPEEVPSSVTVTITENADDDDITETATDGAATIDAVSTTFDATSGNGETDPRVCYLAATTNVVKGRPYRVTNAAGEAEVGEVIAIDSANSVTFRHPLGNSYAAGATFKGLRITQPLLDAWCADENNVSNILDPNPRYRARYEYTAGAVKHVRAAYFDLCRYTGIWSVTAADVDAHFPGYLANLDEADREDQGHRQLVAAYDQLKWDLYADWKPDQAIRNLGIIDALLIHKANAMQQLDKLLRGGGSEGACDRAERLFEKRYAQLIREPVAPFDQGGGGAASPARRRPIFQR